MKKLAIIAGILIGLVLLLVIVLEFVVDLNAYKGQITEPLKNALQRNVEIGDIDLTLLQGLGAEIRDIIVTDPDQSESLLKVKYISVHLKIWPLLLKKIEFSKVSVNEPVLLLKRDREGEWNIDDLLGKKIEASPLSEPEEDVPALPDATPIAESTPKEEAKVPQPSAKSPSSFSKLVIDSLRLIDGKVRVIDELLDVTTELNQLIVDFKGIMPDSPIRFQLSADVAGGEQGNINTSGEIGPISADGNFENVELDMIARLDQIDVAHFSPYYQTAQVQPRISDSERLNATFKLAGNIGKQIDSTGDVSVGDVKVAITGNVQGVNTAPKLDLTISSQAFPWEKLIQLLPPNIAKPLKELGLSGLGNVTIQPKGPVDNLVISGEFDLSQSVLQYQNIFAKPEALPTSIMFEMTLKHDSLFLSSLVLTVGGVEFNVAGTVTNFKQPVLDFELTSNEFSVADFLPLFPEVLDQNLLHTEGIGIIKASAKGLVDDLALQLTANLDESAIAYSNIFQKTIQIPTNLHLEALLGKDTFSIKTLIFVLNELQLTAKGELRNFKKPQFDLVLETNESDVEVLFAHFPILTKEYLPKELTITGPGKLHMVSAGPVDNLNLSGSVDMSKGQITFGEYFSKPSGIPKIIDFDTILTGDAVELRRVQININDVLFDVTGLISGLRQQAMLDLSLSSNPFALNQLMPVAGMKMAPTGTTEFDVTIHGPLEHLDLRSVVAAKIQCIDVGFFVSKFNQPVQHLNALAELRGQRLTVQQFSGTIGSSSLDGDVVISQVFTHPEITFAVHASHLDFDELNQTDTQAFETSFASPFRFVANTQTGPTPRLQSPPNTTSKEKKFSLRDVWHLSNIIAKGAVTIDRGLARNVHFSDLTADLDVRNQLVLIEHLLFRLYDGSYEGNVQLDLSSPEPKYTLRTKLIHVDTNEILRDSASLTDVLYGFLFANTSFRGQGTKTEQVINSLSGKGRIQIRNGKFTTFDIWPQLAEIFQLIGLIGQSDALQQIGDEFSQFPKETRFSRFEGNFTLQDGQAGSSDMILEIPERDMHIALLLDGEFGLNLSLDFLGKIRFAPQSKYYQDLKKYFHDFKQADDSIEIPFPIPIGGTLLEPEISMESMQKSMTAFAKELAKEEVQTQLEKAGKALLQDLFK